ncbi:Hypothetical predicted protein [Pelobates cultripes]|uniref:Uncharacterized protein n=1 Tax=Pelobates cultripes TaxID=61616 RepID=A0AAD1VJE7_PELCU|nr:Hypothetical predicted protein [Pelobates cultripes]
MEESNISFDCMEVDGKKDKEMVTINQLEFNLRDILMELKKEMATNALEIKQEIKYEINQLASKMQNFEDQFTALDFHVNKIKEVNEKVLQKLNDLEFKTNDLEDSLRRKNLRFRNFEQTSKSEDLKQSRKEYFTASGLIFKEQEETIQRCHRLSKPQNVPAEAPRDIIAYFY